MMLVAPPSCFIALQSKAPERKVQKKLVKFEVPLPLASLSGSIERFGVLGRCTSSVRPVAGRLLPGDVDFIC